MGKYYFSQKYSDVQKKPQYLNFWKFLKGYMIISYILVSVEYLAETFIIEDFLCRGGSIM